MKSIASIGIVFEKTEIIRFQCSGQEMHGSTADFIDRIDGTSCTGTFTVYEFCNAVCLCISAEQIRVMPYD